MMPVLATIIELDGTVNPEGRAWVDTWIVPKLLGVIPEMILLIGACACLATGLWRSAAVRRATPWVAGAALVLAGIAALFPAPLSYGTPYIGFASYVKVAVACVGLVLLLVAAGVPDTLRQVVATERADRFEPGDTIRGEFYAFFLFSLTGVMLTAGATDLVWLFLALELTSLPTYGYGRHRSRPTRGSGVGGQILLPRCPLGGGVSLWLRADLWRDGVHRLLQHPRGPGDGCSDGHARAAAGRGAAAGDHGRGVQAGGVPDALLRGRCLPRRERGGDELPRLRTQGRGRGGPAAAAVAGDLAGGRHAAAAGDVPPVGDGGGDDDAGQCARAVAGQCEAGAGVQFDRPLGISARGYPRRAGPGGRGSGCRATAWRRCCSTSSPTG